MNKKLYIDLHIHTNASDGKLTIAEIVQRAYNYGLKAIAITDHDTFKGIKKYLNENIQDKDIEVLPGIEVSTIYHNNIVHVLVYGFKFDGEFAKSIEILEKNNLRHYINYKKGLVQINQHDYIEIKSLLKMVKKEGGVSILAHPKRIGLNDNELKKVILELQSYGLSGIESFYKEHSYIYGKRMDLFAKKHNLLSTGGSDFHCENDQMKKIPYKYLDIIREQVKNG